MREIPISASISETIFSSNTSTTVLPLSPPLSTSQTPIASPPQDSNFEKHKDGMQEERSSPQVKNPRTPPSPTSPKSSSDGASTLPLKAPVPNAWKMGSPSRLHQAFSQASDSGRSSKGGQEDDPTKRVVVESHTPSVKEKAGLDGEEELEISSASDDACVDNPRLIGTRRSSEGIAVRSTNVQSQYNRETGFANGDESAPGFYNNSPGHLGETNGSDIGASTSLGMGTSPNPPTKWGSLGFQWTAGPSIWNGGSSNGNGRKNSIVGGRSSPPTDEATATRSVSFSAAEGQFGGVGSGSRSPIGSGSLLGMSPVGSTFLGDDYDQQQPQYRQARSLSFALGQQETDFFGTTKNGNAQLSSSLSSNPQASIVAPRRNSSSAIAHSLDDSDLYGSAPAYAPENLSPPATTPSSLRGVESNYRRSLPSMTEEMEIPNDARHLYDSFDDHDDGSSYTAFTLPKMRSRSKSSTATYGMPSSTPNSSSVGSPLNQVRGYNGLSPQQQPMNSSATAPSSVSSSPYRHRASLGSLPGLSMTSTSEDSAPVAAYANIWQNDSTPADVSHPPSSSVAIHFNTHNASNNQHRRSITTPNEYWPMSGTNPSMSPQHAARLSVSMNGNGNGPDMYTSQNGGTSPENLERVRIQRRFSLNPAASSGMGMQGGMGMNIGMGVEGGMGTNNMGGGYGMGMGSTGSYGEYRYLESGQGLGMLNRSVEPEYAHLNQRRHSVAGPTLSFGNPSQSRYLTDALDALHLDDNSMYGNQLGFNGSVEETSLDDYFDNDEPRAARVAAATASGNYGGISSNMSNANSILSSMNGRGTVSAHGQSHSASRDADAHLGKGVPLHAVPHHGPLYIVEFKAGRSDLFYLVPESSSQLVKKGDLVIVEADRGKDLGKVMNDNITPVQVQMLQQQQAEAAAVAEMGVSIMPDGRLPSMMMGGQPGMPGSGAPIKELHPKRIYRMAQPGEVTMLVTKSQDEAKAILVCQTKVRQKNLPMEVVDAEYQWDRRKLTFYFIAERRIDFRELVRDLFKIYKTRIWMCAVNPNLNSVLGMSALN